MAYNPFGFQNPYQQNPYQTAYYQQMQQPQQTQSSGLISVRSAEEAHNYPVAPGNSVTFKDETAPYVYVKTMGFSQLDRPTFEKYLLVRQDEPPQPQIQPNQSQNNVNRTDELSNEINALKGKIEALEGRFEKLERSAKNAESASDDKPVSAVSK